MAEENRDMLQIRLHVYDTELSVKVPREEEEYYRKAAKLITDTVNSYSAFYKKRKSDKEILYMSLIDIALKYEMEAGRNDTAPYSDILGTLTSEIEEALKK
ncbi:MAG: cell division protein ZapA [Prevotella sp.]|nr:cell division protein ZapA [Prevotella sp.]